MAGHWLLLADVLRFSTGVFLAPDALYVVGSGDRSLVATKHWLQANSESQEYLEEDRCSHRVILAGSEKLEPEDAGAAPCKQGGNPDYPVLLALTKGVITI